MRQVHPQCGLCATMTYDKKSDTKLVSVSLVMLNFLFEWIIQFEFLPKTEPFSFDMMYNESPWRDSFWGFLVTPDVK